MRKFLKFAAFGILIAAGLTAASALYAEGPKRSEGSMMGSGMMGQGGMSGMMSMMGQMSRMMDHCNQMMQGMMEEDGSETPNEQWREKPSAVPEEEG